MDMDREFTEKRIISPQRHENIMNLTGDNKKLN